MPKKTVAARFVTRPRTVEAVKVVDLAKLPAAVRKAETRKVIDWLNRRGCATRTEAGQVIIDTMQGEYPIQPGTWLVSDVNGSDVVVYDDDRFQQKFMRP